MKKILIPMLCLVLLLTGCVSPATQPDKPSDNVSDSSPKDTTETAENTALDKIRSMLDVEFDEYAFELSYMYMHLIYNGFSQTTKSMPAKDGTMYFFTEFKQWNHYTDYSEEEKDEFYYRTEGSDYIAYYSYDGGEVVREYVGEKGRQEMQKSYVQLAGSDAILPKYLRHFEESEKSNQTITYTYQIPVQKIIENYTILTNYIQGAFSCYGSEYDPQLDLSVSCTLEVNAETLQPIFFSCDFSELEPYVLSQGALSGADALQTELMYFTISFDYALQDTAPIPEHFQATLNGSDN